MKAEKTTQKLNGTEITSAYQQIVINDSLDYSAEIVGDRFETINKAIH